MPPLLVEYVDFRRDHVGVAAATICSEVRTVSRFLDRLRDDGRSHGDIRVRDVDDFVTALAGQVCAKTVARACTSLRCFLRFLHFRSYLAHDVAASVAAPRLLRADRPPRGLPWEDVQRLLDAVDVGSRTGRRDRALLLLMATYGMGAAEVLHLRLSDIDWRAGTIHMVRPKTGVECVLPLLSGVALAMVAYLRDGRPPHSATRVLFVRAVAPYGPMSASAVRHAIRQYGRVAGLSAAVLGGHVLRHSHACRQIELGAAPKVVSDILGHRDPASTSNYFRAATTRLRELALPVPA
jgi:site-specific recombinase XerD